MNNIKSWIKFFEAVSLTDKEKWEVGFRVLDAAKSIWGDDLNSDVIIKNHGHSIESELLRKSKNNRNLLNYLNKLSSSTTKRGLEAWIKSNHFNIFHPDGLYFSQVTDILKSASIKGEEMEKLAIDAIREYYKSIGKSIFTFKPSEKKDIDGFDIFFREETNLKSAQVKTLRRVFHGDKWTRVYCNGHITDMKTNYLIAVNEKECYIFNSRIYFKNEDNYSLPSNSQVFYKSFEKDLDIDNLPF
jgi:hypothetical protein